MFPLLLASHSLVLLDADTYWSMQEPPPPPAEIGPGPLVVDRELSLETVGAERIELHAIWHVRVDHRSAVKLRLAGPSVVADHVRFDGAEAPVIRDDQGTALDVILDRDATIELVGFCPGDVGQRVHLELLAAAGGTIDHPGGTRVEGATRIGRAKSAGGSGDLWIEPAPVASTGTGDVVMGETAVGITVGEGAIAVSGRVRWRIARGSLDHVGFTVPGAGPDLAVTGPAIASVTRDGDHVAVALRSADKALVSLSFRYSAPTPAGEVAQVAVPDVRLDDVFRTTSTLELARDPQLDVLPTLPGWQPSAPSELPGWGLDLVEGVPAAAFVGKGGGGSLSVLRFTPADSPATLVDVAEYTVAMNSDGLVLIRARYAVRNDRGSVLQVTPPAGFDPIGVRVGTQPAKLSRSGPVWRVPLEKSVETVQGLLSFPVEVVLLGRVDPWEFRESRELQLPLVDAEVAVSRLTLYLPPGYRSRTRPGRGDAVRTFTKGEGITYGFASGDARAGEADAIFQTAVSAWMSNDFAGASSALGSLEQIGASNEDITRLKSNLELVEGEKKAEDTGVVERRVLEQARVRAQGDEQAQQEATVKADQAYAAGDYAAAEEAYKQAVDLGKNLAKLHNDEDKSQESLNAKVEQKLQGSVAVSSQKMANSMSQVNDVDGDFRADQNKDVSGKQGKSKAKPMAKPVGGEVDEEDEPAVVDTEDTTTGMVLDQSFLTEIPAGRTYQSPVEAPPPPPEVADPEAANRETGRYRNLEDELRGEEEGVEVGVEGGVEGGVAGGVIGGVLGGVAANENSYMIDGANITDLPTTPAAPVVVDGKHTLEFEGEDIEGELVKPEGARDQRVAGPAHAAATPRVGVTASELSVVVPANGAAVFYQHLLLPTGTVWVVPIEAREPRRYR